MSEWLDLMLEEVARKQREQREADDETRRRSGQKGAQLTGQIDTSTSSQAK